MEVLPEDLEKEQAEMTVKINNMYKYFKGKKVMGINELYKLRRKEKSKRRKVSVLKRIARRFSPYILEYLENKRKEHDTSVESIETAIEICGLLDSKDTFFIKKQITKKDMIRQIAKLSLCKKIKSKKEAQQKEEKDETEAVILSLYDNE